MPSALPVAAKSTTVVGDTLFNVALRTIDHLPHKFVAAEERLFWPYLLGALVLAGLSWLLSKRSGGLVGFVRWLAPEGFWRAGSVHADIWLALVWGAARSVTVALLVMVPGVVSSLGAVLWLVATMDTWLGAAEPPIPGSLMTSGWALPWVYGLALFVVWDVSRYGLHRLLHGVDALWQIHQVHHSATVLTPLTLHRSHPIEAALYATTQWVVTVGMTAVAVRLIGAHVVPVELLGVNAFGFVLSLLGGNLRHSHAALAYPDWLERWLVSPAQHQLHHSTDAALQRCNYGVWLACWDRLAGSLHHGDSAQEITFGVAPEDLNHNPERALSALVGPVRAWVRVDASRAP